MRRRWRQWRALPARERRLLALLACMQPLIGGGLRLLGCRRTRGIIDRLTLRAQPARTATAADLRDAERLTVLAKTAGLHGPLPSTCLRQALAVYALLRKRGLAPQVRFGLSRTHGNADLHAWVALDTHDLDTRADQYAALEQSPASTERT